MSIREEWHDFYRFTWKDGLTPDMIEAWWTTTLKERIEAERKDIPGKLEHLHDLGLAKTARRRHTNHARGFNEGLDTITRLLE